MWSLNRWATSDSPSSLELPWKGKHQVTVPLLHSWADLLFWGCSDALSELAELGGSRRRSPAGTVAPCPLSWGIAQENPALSVGSIPTRRQWLEKRKYKVFFLTGVLALQMASLASSSPKGFQVLFLYLWNMNSTDWGNNNLTLKVMKETASHRDIKATKRQIRVKWEKEKKKREKRHS